MKTNQLKLFLPLAAIILAVACKKNDSDGGSSGSAADKIKDTTISYARDIYLWYTQIPANFNARSYADPSAIMTAIRAYSQEPGFTTPVDRWSFAMKQTEWDDLSNSVASDFGLNVFFLAEGDLRVRLVEKESPAARAGIRRGWKITKINGNTNITTGNANFIVNAIYQSSSVSLSFAKPDGSTADLVLSGATYQGQPVYLDSVYATGGKKIGYMVYNSFLGDSLQTVNGFQRVFNRFAAEAVNDVIIDLRYNGGGRVDYQATLANYLIKTSAATGLMMRQQYNDKYSQYNSSINFSKKGTLNLPRVFFIVSENTASASELLINNLKPHMEVVIVGPSKTHGKPVGYFNIPVGDWYIFPVSLRTTNSLGQGNYFTGFDLNNRVADGLDKDWGDLTESCLASAVKYITTGAFRVASQQERALVTNPAILQANTGMSKTIFKGMVAERPH